MKHRMLALSVLALTTQIAVSQARPTAERPFSQEVTVQAGGFFARALTDNGVRYKPTSTGSADFGYRLHFNRWLGVGADFDYFKDTQKYTTASATFASKTNVAAVSGGAVLNLPNPLTNRFSSFMMVGGGALIFRPDTKDAPFETKNAIVVGGGIDIPPSRHLAIRAQSKSFLYKAPDFGRADLHTSKFAQAMVPTAGVVWKF